MSSTVESAGNLHTKERLNFETSRTLYAQITDIHNLALAHRHAKRGKGWYKEVLAIDANPEPYLTKLQTQLLIGPIKRVSILLLPSERVKRSA